MWAELCHVQVTGRRRHRTGKALPGQTIDGSPHSMSLPLQLVVLSLVSSLFPICSEILVLKSLPVEEPQPRWKGEVQDYVGVNLTLLTPSPPSHGHVASVPRIWWAIKGLYIWPLSVNAKLSCRGAVPSGKEPLNPQVCTGRGGSQVIGPSCIQSSLWVHDSSPFLLPWCSSLHESSPIQPLWSSQRPHYAMPCRGILLHRGRVSVSQLSSPNSILYTPGLISSLSPCICTPNQAPESSVRELSKMAGCELPSVLNCTNGSSYELGYDGKWYFSFRAIHVFSVHPGSSIAVTFQPRPRCQASPTLCQVPKHIEDKRTVLGPPSANDC